LPAEVASRLFSNVKPESKTAPQFGQKAGRCTTTTTKVSLDLAADGFPARG
jgi:hypothetical protein